MKPVQKKSAFMSSLHNRHKKRRQSTLRLRERNPKSKSNSNTTNGHERERQKTANDETSIATTTSTTNTTSSTSAVVSFENGKADNGMNGDHHSANSSTCSGSHSAVTVKRSGSGSGTGTGTGSKLKLNRKSVVHVDDHDHDHDPVTHKTALASLSSKSNASGSGKSKLSPYEALTMEDESASVGDGGQYDHDCSNNLQGKVKQVKGNVGESEILQKDTITKVQANGHDPCIGTDSDATERKRTSLNDAQSQGVSQQGMDHTGTHQPDTSNAAQNQVLATAPSTSVTPSHHPPTPLTNFTSFLTGQLGPLMENYIQTQIECRISEILQTIDEKMDILQIENSQLKIESISKSRQVHSLQASLDSSREALKKEKRKYEAYAKKMDAWLDKLGVSVDKSTGEVTMKLRGSFQAPPTGMESQVESQGQAVDHFGDTQGFANDGILKDEIVEKGEHLDRVFVKRELDQGLENDNDCTLQHSEGTMEDNVNAEEKSPRLDASSVTRQHTSPEPASLKKTPSEDSSPTQSPIPSPRRSPRNLHPNRVSDVRNFAADSTRTSNYRSSGSPSFDKNSPISLPPKKLDYSSALPVKEEESSQDLQFSIQVDDSSDDETAINTEPSRHGTDEKTMSHLTTMVTPAAGDLRKGNRRNISMCDASNEHASNARFSIKRTNRSPQKRPSPESSVSDPKASKKAKKSSNLNHSATKSKQPAEEYKYREVVRGKKAREQLHGHDCKCCKGFLDAVCSGKGADHFDRNSLIQNYSRHRARFSPDHTPDGFWEPSFADSIADRLEAEKQLRDEELSQSQSQGREKGAGTGTSQESFQDAKDAIEQSLAY